MVSKSFKSKALLAFSSIAIALSVGSAIDVKPAAAAGTVPASIQKGIDDTIATVGALDGIAIACLAVALTPVGAMLTLRFLNMVLARI